jgi:hypothetical protein
MDAATTTHPAGVASPVFTMLGDPTAAACEGDFCEIPVHHEQAIINRRIDEGAI